MGASGFRRATVYKASDPEDYIELKKLTQDSQYAKSDITAEDLDGNLIVLEEEATLNLGFYDEADVDKLKTWKAAGEKMNVVVIGLEDYIFWDRDSTFSMEEPAAFNPRGRNVRRLRFRGRGVDLLVERATPIQVYDGDGNKLIGFAGTASDADGVTVRSLPPASYGAQSTFTWTIDAVDYVMDTIILNTLN